MNERFTVVKVWRDLPWTWRAFDHIMVLICCEIAGSINTNSLLQWLSEVWGWIRSAWTVSVFSCHNNKKYLGNDYGCSRSSNSRIRICHTLDNWCILHHSDRAVMHSCWQLNPEKEPVRFFFLLFEWIIAFTAAQVCYHEGKSQRYNFRSSKFTRLLVFGSYIRYKLFQSILWGTGTRRSWVLRDSVILGRRHRSCTGCWDTRLCLNLENCETTIAKVDIPGKVHGIFEWVHSPFCAKHQICYRREHRHHCPAMWTYQSRSSFLSSPVDNCKNTHCQYLCGSHSRHRLGRDLACTCPSLQSNYRRGIWFLFLKQPAAIKDIWCSTLTFLDVWWGRTQIADTYLFWKH